MRLGMRVVDALTSQCHKARHLQAADIGRLPGGAAHTSLLRLSIQHEYVQGAAAMLLFLLIHTFSGPEGSQDHCAAVLC